MISCVSTLFFLQNVGQHPRVVRLSIFALPQIKRLIRNDTSLANHDLRKLGDHTEILIWYTDWPWCEPTPITELDVIRTNVVIRFDDSFTLTPLICCGEQAACRKKRHSNNDSFHHDATHHLTRKR